MNHQTQIDELKAFFTGRKLPNKPYLITARIGEIRNPRRFVEHHIHIAETHQVDIQGCESLKILNRYRDYCKKKVK